MNHDSLDQSYRNVCAAAAAYVSGAENRTPRAIRRSGDYDFDLHRLYHNAVECLAGCERMIQSLREEVASKNDRIAGLEERIVGMSLELASSKARQDEMRLERRLSGADADGALVPTVANEPCTNQAASLSTSQATDEPRGALRPKLDKSEGSGNSSRILGALAGIFAGDNSAERGVPFPKTNDAARQSASEALIRRKTHQIKTSYREMPSCKGSLDVSAWGRSADDGHVPLASTQSNSSKTIGSLSSTEGVLLSVLPREAVNGSPGDGEAPFDVWSGSSSSFVRVNEEWPEF